MTARIAWVVGWNVPGEGCTDLPIEARTWAEAFALLRAELGEHFIHKVDSETFDREVATMNNYVEASTIIRDAREDHPLCVIYDGLIWWVADLLLEDDTPVQ